MQRVAGAGLVDAGVIPLHDPAEARLNHDRAAPRERPAARVESDRQRHVTEVAPVLVSGGVVYRDPNRPDRLPSLGDGGVIGEQQVGPGTRRRRRRWRSASDDERTLARAAGRNAHRERIRARYRTGGWYSTERDHVIACADAWDREARAGPDRSGSIPVDGESIPAGPIDAARRRRDRDITGLGRR